MQRGPNIHDDTLNLEMSLQINMSVFLVLKGKPQVTAKVGKSNIE